MKMALLPYLAGIYDPLDLTPAVTLIGTQHYCHICDSKLAWDAQRHGPFLKRWKDWLLAQTDTFTVPQEIAVYWEPILQLTLHAFGDVTSKRVCGTVYAVVQQTQGTTQRLICNKSCFARRNMPVPRLELIAGHMALNIATNIQTMLKDITSTVYCLLDSTATLYWIKKQGEYCQFVANRVNTIQSYSQVTWHHFPTADNPDYAVHLNLCFKSSSQRGRPEVVHLDNGSTFKPLEK